MASQRASGRNRLPSAKVNANRAPPTPAASASRKRKASRATIAPPRAPPARAYRRGSSGGGGGRAEIEQEEEEELVDEDEVSTESEEDDRDTTQQLTQQLGQLRSSPPPSEQREVGGTSPLPTSSPLQRTRSPSPTRYDLKYRCAMRLVCGKQPLAVHSFNFTGLDELFDTVDRLVESKKSHTLERVNITASYRGCKKDDRLSTDIESNADFDKVLFAMLAGLKDGQQEHRVDVVVYMEKVVEEPVSTPSGPRGSATQRQIAASAIAQGNAMARGDYTSNVYEVWSCDQHDCYNKAKGGFCYWRQSNTAANHMPITKEIVTQWSKDVRDSKATPGEPTLDVHTMLYTAKKSLTAARVERAEKSRAQPEGDYRQQPYSHQQPQIQQFFGVMPWGGAGGTTGVLLGENNSTVAHDDPPSSQPTESGAIELMEQFFEWAGGQAVWRDYVGDLARVKEVLMDEGYDMKDTRKISNTEWVTDLKLRRGAYGRLMDSIDRWKRSCRSR